MSPVAEAGTFMAQGKTFAQVVKKFRPREAKILAVRHHGAPAQYQTEHGSETAQDGDYVVQTGTLERQETIPARDGKDGKRVPGEIRTVLEPKLEVMKAQDFEALYESA